MQYKASCTLLVLGALTPIGNNIEEVWKVFKRTEKVVLLLITYYDTRSLRFKNLHAN